MAFWGDYHTHTVYSHGKGSIEDNVFAAARAGLRALGITDHGFNHMAYNLRRGELPDMRRQLAELRIKYPQVRVLLGVEANILSRSGNIDVRASDKPNLDITVCGYHKLVWASPKAATSYFLANNTGSKSVRTMARNTDAYVRAIEQNSVDILSHPGNGCVCDVREVARACKRFGTYFELNGKRIYLTDDELATAAAEGCEFICSSDAHTPRRVGDFSLPLARMQRVGIPLSAAANYERFPSFRSEKQRAEQGGRQT